MINHIYTQVLITLTIFLFYLQIQGFVMLAKNPKFPNTHNINMFVFVWMEEMKIMTCINLVHYLVHMRIGYNVNH